jgi:hypothetical protein
MQDLPDRNVLLQAVAGFLHQDVVPQVADRALAFRLRIAAHLVATVARELLVEEAPPPAGEGRDLRHAAIRGATDRLVEQARTADPDSDAALALRRLVQADLRAKLAVINPGFDLSPDVEADPG